VKCFFFIVHLGLFCVSTVAAADANSGLDGFLDGLETLSASFEQRLLNEYGEELEVSGGRMYLRQPGMFHWAYETPYEQYLISDGIRLWIYDRDLEQVTIRDVKTVIDDSPAAILGGDVDIERHYLVTEQTSSDGLQWLVLTPRDEESQYVAIRLAFEGAKPAKMILFDRLGQTTQIEFHGVKRNPPLDRTFFQFEAPEGVDVIESRAAVP